MMKKILKIIMGSACLVSMQTPAFAQSAFWIVKPNYIDITPFTANTYKVKTYSSMGIIDSMGRNLVESADSITNVTNGYALVLKSVGGKYKISAILDEKSSLTPIKQELYAGDYPFFSEGLCAVYDKKGNYGFIDSQGKLVVPCAYAAVHPFREGLASVSKQKGGLKKIIKSAVNIVSEQAAGGIRTDLGPASYIDTKGVVLKLQGEIGTPLLASSFSNGQALVQNDEGKFFFINRQGKIDRIETDVKLQFDDFFALSAEGRKGNVNAPYQTVYNSSCKPFLENGKYGYRSNGHVVLPAQFEDAKGFAQNRAIAKHDGRYGLLMLSSANVSCSVNEVDGKLQASATLPTEWDNISVNLFRSQEGQGERNGYMLNGVSGTRGLVADVPSSFEKQLYELEAEQIVLWRSTDVDIKESQDKAPSSVGKSESVRRGIAVSAPSSIKSNDKGVCNIPVSVTNRSSQSATITVSASTGGSTSIKLGPGRSGSVTLSAKVLRNTRCTIKGSSSVGNASCTTTLKPAFVL